MQAGQLLIHRQHRIRRLGIYSSSTYADPEAIRKEIEFFNDMMIQRGISLIDVTNKPLETSADEVMRIITRRFGEQNRRE